MFCQLEIIQASKELKIEAHHSAAQDLNYRILVLDCNL